VKKLVDGRLQYSLRDEGDVSGRKRRAAREKKKRKFASYSMPCDYVSTPLKGEKKKKG